MGRGAGVQGGKGEGGQEAAAKIRAPSPQPLEVEERPSAGDSDAAACRGGVGACPGGLRVAAEFLRRAHGDGRGPG